jgi:hypothetical protein
MAITGDRYVGSYQGHKIELVRDNWVKTLTLLIDGREAASESCMIPKRIILNGVLDLDGGQVAVVAKSIPRRFFWATDTIEIDGQLLDVAKSK